MQLFRHPIIKSIICLPMVFLLGCAHTQSISDSIRWQSNPIREFKSSSDGFQIYNGIYLGTKKQNEMRYREYAVEESLSGYTNRVLYMYIPMQSDTSQNIYITDSSDFSKCTSTTSAYEICLIIVTDSLTLSKPDDSTIFPHHQAGYMKEYLLFSKYDSLELYQKARNKKWIKVDSTIQLEWVVRKKSKVLQKNLCYLYALPLDCVSSVAKFIWFFLPEIMTLSQ